ARSRPTSSPCLQWSSSAQQSPRSRESRPAARKESEQYHGTRYPTDQHFLGRDGRLVRCNRACARRRPCCGSRDGCHCPAARLGRDGIAHPLCRTGDDRDDGDLRSRRRAAGALRQPIREVRQALMQIDWWTLGLQTINAVVLIWLLAHFLFRPVVGAIDARQKAAGQLLADAKAAKAAAEGERAKAAAEVAQLAQQRSEALKAAEAEAAASKSALLATAETEADKLRAAAKAQIEDERRTEALAAEDRAGRLAVDIAAKLFDKLPRQARVSAFIDGIATGLEKLPEGARASVGADGASIHLTVARAVTPQEEEACRKALAGVLGHAVAVDVTVDPTLIAGIELEAPHAIVRNSFRADLVRLKRELVHHDTDVA